MPNKKMPLSRLLIFAVPGLVSAGVIVGVFLVLTEPSNQSGGADSDPMQVAGEAIYRDHCASCHGAELEGQPNWRARLPSGRLPAPPHDETGHTWHHADEVLFGITKLGPGGYMGLADYQSDMPAFETVLSDDEIWSVLRFIKDQWPTTIRTRQEQMSQ